VPAVVVCTAMGLSVVRWAHNYHLFTLGALSLIAATVARTALRQCCRNRGRLHITEMGLSYRVIATAFYVDNGKSLPADLLIVVRGRRALALGERKCRR